MAIISFGKIDKKLIPLVVGCVINSLYNIILVKFVRDSLIYLLLFNTISKFLILIPFLIEKKNSNKFYSNNIENINNKNYIPKKYNIEQEKTIKGKWKFLILSAVIDFIQSFIFLRSIYDGNLFWNLYILVTSLFYYLMFKIKLYKHHYLSFILIMLIGFIIDISVGYFKNFSKKIDRLYPLFLFRFGREILNSFHIVLDKYIIEKKFGSIYEIFLSNGIISLILSAIFIIFTYFFLQPLYYEKYFNTFKNIELLIIFGYIITNFGLSLCILITNKNYTPCHIFIIYLFGPLVWYITVEQYISIPFIILILFFSLIFNEIIELNFWGLSFNTKKNIIKS